MGGWGEERSLKEKRCAFLLLWEQEKNHEKRGEDTFRKMGRGGKENGRGRRDTRVRREKKFDVCVDMRAIGCVSVCVRNSIGFGFVLFFLFRVLKLGGANCFNIGGYVGGVLGELLGGR